MLRLIALLLLLAAPARGLELYVLQGPATAGQGELLLPLFCLGVVPQDWAFFRDEVPVLEAPETEPFRMDSLSLPPSAGEVTLLIQSRFDVTVATRPVTEPAVLGLTDPQPRFLGDLNADGRLGVGDAVRILRSVRDPLEPPPDLAVSDVNGDTFLDTADLAALLYQLVRRNRSS